MSEGPNHTIDTIVSTESFLTTNGIDFETIRHPVAMTVDEMVQYKTDFKTSDQVAMAKHLFLHDKKKKEGGRMWLVVAKPDEPIGEHKAT